MPLIIVGTIGIYFLVLPKVAPKQITVAVMPFHTTTSVEMFLLNSLAQEIAEGLTYSRDLIIVDFNSSVEASKLRREFRAYTQELGASHLLVGSIERTMDGEFQVTSILVNISQPAAREKWKQSVAVTEHELPQIPRRVVNAVREKLYDRGSGATPFGPESRPDAYQSYLQALHAERTGDYSNALEWTRASISAAASASALTLFSRLSDSSDRILVLKKALDLNPDYLGARSALAEATFQQHREIPRYHEQLVALAERYPNSEALVQLARLYHALGHYQEAAGLFYRAVRTQARHGSLAVELILARFRAGEGEDLESLLYMATQRGNQDRDAARTLALYRIEHGLDEAAAAPSDPVLAAITSANAEDWDQYEVSSGQIEENDWQMIAHMSAGKTDEALELLPQSENWWAQPPLWWKESDPRWVAFASDERYRSHLDARGLSNQQLALVQAVDPDKLLRPKKLGTLRDLSSRIVLSD